MDGNRGSKNVSAAVILVAELLAVIQLLWFGPGSLDHMMLCVCFGLGPRGGQDRAGVHAGVGGTRG